MKRLVLCGTAALLTLAASTRPAAALSGYLVCWGRTAPAPAAQTTEKASSGYTVRWGKGEATERASSGYGVTWGRSGYMVSWGKGQAAE